MKGVSENVVISNNLIKLTISGVNNNVTIKSHVNNLRISGTGNIINGLDPNCLIDSINVQGLSNDINLNQNCANVRKNIAGLQNQFKINGVPLNDGNNVYNNNNNYNRNNNFNNNRNNANVNQRVIRIVRNNGNGQSNFVINNGNMDDINDIMNDFRDFGININLNNQNVNANVNNNNNNNNNEEQNNNNNNLSDFDKKKQDLFLEMDEYQYKHIQKYESRKETECAICLEEFKGIDIIKAFYKCEHIFHKNCLKNWLKRSNVCPLCKHDLTEDINNMH